MGSGRSGDEDVVEGRTFGALDVLGPEVTGREFRDCVFKGARLQDTRFRDCTFEASVFEDCDLAQMRPMQVAFHDVRFEKCRLVGSDWTGVSRHPDVTLVDCDLRYSIFIRLDLRKTRFVRCNAQDANFVEVDLVDAAFLDCDLSGAMFERCELLKADFTTSRGVFIEPGKNRVKGARVPIETAVMLAQAAGLKIAGHDPGVDDAPPARPAGRPRR